MTAILLGVVQGLTEYLPVSSDAHVRLTMVALGMSDVGGAAYTAMIHFGTILAVLLYFWKDIVAALRGWFKSLGGSGNKNSPEARLGWAVVLGTIPVVVAALVLKKPVETTFRSIYYIAFAFIGMGIVMLCMDRFGKNNRKSSSITIVDGLIVGAWQIFALIPGMSRSGSTIAGAQSRGFDRESAAKLSFLIAIPTITGAGLFEAYHSRHELAHGMMMPVVVGNIVSFVVGYAAIAFLMQFLKKYGVGVFVAYRIVLGIVLIAMMQSGHLSPTAGADDDTAKPAATAMLSR
ncbi:MAG: undecaprenyl-diphosphatase UppP [Fimbriimonas sp.]|nr:undecaprenyl-diphosphatase UppP [Fimbriimonas sp.]